MFIIGILAVALSGVIGMLLDTVWGIDFRGIYWFVGLIGGTIWGLARASSQ